MHMVIKNTVGSSQGGFVCCGHTIHEVEWFELRTYMKDTYHIIIGMRHPHLYILSFFFFLDQIVHPLLISQLDGCVN